MDIDLIFKIAGTGIIVAVLNLVLKRAERRASNDDDLGWFDCGIGHHCTGNWWTV